MYYPCSENKDTDQLRGYREADLRLCFRPCKLLVFSRTGSYSKTGVYRGVPNFLIFDPKHTLWVFLRTAYARRF